MERIFYNRWVMLGACLLALGAIYASFNDGFRSAIGTGSDQPNAARQAQEAHEASDDAMAKWQDETGLIDKTGEEEPQPAVSPSLPLAAPQPVPAGDDAGGGAAAE